MSFFIRDPVSGRIVPQDVFSAQLTPVLSSSGLGITNTFEVRAPPRIVLGPEVVPTTAYGNIVTYGASPYTPYASFAVIGAPGTMGTGVRQNAFAVIDDGGAALGNIPGSTPNTGIEGLYLTNTMGSDSWGLTSWGGKRGPLWHTSAASTITSKVGYRPSF
jgi:hypothetical protein